MIACEKYENKRNSAATCLAQIEKQRQKNIQENRDNLKKLIEITILLAKQCISFRGHNEDETSINKGNFKEISYFVAQRDSSLHSFLNNSANANYLSPEIQNELIQIISNLY